MCVGEGANICGEKYKKEGEETVFMLLLYRSRRVTERGIRCSSQPIPSREGKKLPWGLLQKTQTRKMPDLAVAVVARTPFWLFCAGQRRIGPGQTTDGTWKPNPNAGYIYFLPPCLPPFASSGRNRYFHLFFGRLSFGFMCELCVPFCIYWPTHHTNTFIGGHMCVPRSKRTSSLVLTGLIS